MASILKVDQLQLSDGSTPTAADLGIDVAGTVVQLYRHEWSDYSLNTANDTFATANGSAFSFTPKLANSTLMIKAEIEADIYNNNNYSGGGIRIVHDGTALTPNSALTQYIYVLQATPIDWYTKVERTWEVSAGSTSARTIYLQFAPYGSSEFNINNTSTMRSSITVYEIAQ